MRTKSANRREFLKTAGLTVAAPYVIASTALGAGGRAPASERIVMAAIGCGDQGTSDLRAFLSFGDTQLVAACDPVSDHRENAKNIVNGHYKNKDCASINDFREILARDDIDAVHIGTPDHWHAIITINACRNGKDVYCQKPECLTIREGRAMVSAARRYGRVVSGGSQRVLDDFGDMARQVRGGAIGEVKEVFVSTFWGPSGDCGLPPQPVPPGVDWDMWLGPAPWRPFHEKLIHGNFRPFRDYSGGGVTDWGAHRIGAAMFATGRELAGPVEVIPPDGKDHKYLTHVFADGMRMVLGGTDSVKIVGTEGEYPGKTRPATGHVEMPGYRGRGGIYGDFLDCVRTRCRPFRDIEIGHRTATLCHLSNIVYWLNRPMKWNESVFRWELVDGPPWPTRSIRWDPVKEEIFGDNEAARWLDRSKREPWIA